MSTFENLEYFLGIEMERRECIIKRSDVCPTPPHQIYIEATNVCNNRCVMCIPPDKKGKLGYIPVERWKRIIDSMAANGMRFPVTMIGRGEPLLHKNIVELVEYGSRHDVPCFIITNATRMTKSLSKALLEAGVRKMQISLHANTPEVYEKITRRNSFADVRQNLLDLIELNENMGKPCYVSVMAVESSVNTHEIDEFERFWTPKVDRCFVTKLASVQEKSGMKDEANALPFLRSEHPGCVLPWYYFGFRWDGSINPCPYDFEGKYVVGHADDPDFDIMKIWNGEFYKAFRRAHCTKDFTLPDSINYTCRTCTTPRIPDGLKGMDEWADKFHKAFTRVYAPLMR